MSDSRRRKPRDPPYWLTGPKGGKSANGKQLPFVSLYADLLQSEEFQKRLSHVDKLVYIAMGLEAKGSKEFSFTESTAKQYGFSGMALRRSVQDLVDAGFISIVENNRTRRKPNIYRFEVEWKLPKRPTPPG